MESIGAFIDERQRITVLMAASTARWEGSFREVVSEGIIITAPIQKVERTVFLPWSAIASVVIGDAPSGKPEVWPAT